MTASSSDSLETPVRPAAQGTIEAGRRRTYTTMLAPSLVLMFVMTIVPGLYLLLASFTPMNLTNPRTAWDFSDPFVNYKLLPFDSRFLDSVWVQIKLSATTVTMQLIFGLLLALLLNIQNKVLAAFRTIFLIPMVLPPIVVAIIYKILYTPDISPVHQFFDWLGYPFPSLITSADWALTAIIIADTWQWFPFTMLMILAALQMMPEEPIEAAHIDGANAIQVTWYVVLPFLRPVLLVAGLFRLVDSIKAFPLIYILTNGGPGNVTEVTNYHAFQQAFNYSYLGWSSAISMVMLVATFVLSWWVMRTVGLRGDLE